MIPSSDLKKSVELIKSEFLSDWESPLYKNESICERFRRKLKVKCVVSSYNGTDTIIIVLQTMGMVIGDYVGIPNLTFWSTYGAAVQLDVQPRLILKSYE